MATREKGSRPGNYAEEARTYDFTRGASPTVVRAVSRFLGPAGGRKLLDIAGGTGNYAQVLQARGLRAELDESSEKLGAKIRDAQLQKIPYTLVVGDKEVDQKAVSPRRHGEGKDAEMGTLPLVEFVDQLAKEATVPYCACGRVSARPHEALTQAGGRIP